MPVIAFSILEPITENSQLRQQTYNFAFLFYKQTAAHLSSTICETQILPFVSQAAIISMAFLSKSEVTLSIFYLQSV